MASPSGHDAEKMAARFFPVESPSFFVNWVVMNFVQLRAYDNYISAHISMGMLQDAGINCHLENEHTITLDPFLSPALGGMKLMVYPTQVERAVRLLEQAESNRMD